MASFACPVCNIYRRSTTRNWHQAQIDNLERCGTVVVGRYNACRMCNPECWVDPITPYVPLYLGALHPYACAVCRIIRPHSHRFWTKSQLKSICSLRTSVTPQHNCCRVCDSSCWYSNLNEGVSIPMGHSPHVEPVPTVNYAPSTESGGQLDRDVAPSSPCSIPAHIVPWPVSQSMWRPLPPSALPLIRCRPPWLDQDAIQYDIYRIQREIPQEVWETLVRSMPKAELKAASHIGACLIPNSPMGLEAIIRCNGGADIRGSWVSFHAASLMIANPTTPIFVDVRNQIYKKFITEIWPRSKLWETYSNEIPIGDIVEAALGVIITDWCDAMSHDDSSSRFTDDPRYLQLQRISRICLAAFCDSYHGPISISKAVRPAEAFWSTPNDDLVSRPQ